MRISRIVIHGFEIKPSFLSSNSSIKRDYQKRDDKRDEDRDSVYRQLSRSSFERVRSRLASAIPAIVITLPDNLELLITRDTYRAAISSPLFYHCFSASIDLAHMLRVTPSCEREHFQSVNVNSSIFLNGNYV